MQIVSSARRTGSDCASAVEWAITVRIPISRQVRMIRSAISPRLAMRILWNIPLLALEPRGYALPLVDTLRRAAQRPAIRIEVPEGRDRKSTRLNSSHGYISYAVFCLKKKKQHLK